jgi:peroxiredoxin
MRPTQKLASFAIVLTVAASALATTVVPRKSPEFTIFEPSGKETTLSSFKGKVIVIEFLFLKSAHCLRVAQTLNLLHRELGPQGFQPVGIAFGPDADMQRVTYLAEDFKLTYPVGYASFDKVDNYLARESNEILNVPQIIVIDRAGVIRAQSGRKGGNPTLESENSLRSLVDGLLKEEAPPDNRRASGVTRKKGN